MSATSTTYNIPVLLLTVQQAAVALGLSLPTTKRRLYDGTIRSVVIGGARRVPLRELEALIASRLSRRSRGFNAPP